MLFPASLAKLADGARLAIAGVVLGSVLGSCRGSTQRLPEPDLFPAQALVDPAPPGVETTLVVRHGDPVRLRPRGAVASFPLAFYRKRERISAHGWIEVGQGGKAELLWPGDATAAMLFDTTLIELGELDQDEPLFWIHDLTGARLMLTPEDVIALPGGAELRGDPVLPSGPFFLERIDRQFLRVTNQAKRACIIAFRDSVLDLAPGSELVIPILPDSRPVRGGEGQRLVVGGQAFEAFGEVRSLGSGPDRGGFEARTTGRVHGQGVRVSLAPGDQAVFGGLGARDLDSTLQGQAPVDEEVPEDPPPPAGERP